MLFSGLAVVVLARGDFERRRLVNRSPEEATAFCEVKGAQKGSQHRTERIRTELAIRFRTLPHRHGYGGACENESRRATRASEATAPCPPLPALQPSAIYVENDVPQPQFDFAFGFSNLNPAAVSVFT